MQDTRSTRSAKLLLNKWMILTVLLSNSWLVNYKQPKRNNIGKVLCISWAVEICFYNQKKSSRTLTLKSIVCSYFKYYFPQTKYAIFFVWEWKHNSSCLMKSNRAQQMFRGRGKRAALDTLSTQTLLWVSLHTATAYELFCKCVHNLSFLQLRTVDLSKAGICFYFHAFCKVYKVQCSLNPR